jgi:hypothetical protein
MTSEKYYRSRLSPVTLVGEGVSVLVVFSGVCTSIAISFATDTDKGTEAGKEAGADTATAAVAVTGVRGTGVSKTFAYTSKP